MEEHGLIFWAVADQDGCQRGWQALCVCVGGGGVQGNALEACRGQCKGDQKRTWPKKCTCYTADNARVGDMSPQLPPLLHCCCS